VKSTERLQSFWVGVRTNNVKEQQLPAKFIL